MHLSETRCDLGMLILFIILVTVTGFCMNYVSDKAVNWLTNKLAIAEKEESGKRMFLYTFCILAFAFLFWFAVGLGTVTVVMNAVR